jgi:hypothetical protein
MSQQNTQIDNNNYKKVLIKNSSCCGAASDAWVPSYSSLSIKNQSSSDKSESESSSLLLSDNNFLRLKDRIIESEDL